MGFRILGSSQAGQTWEFNCLEVPPEESAGMVLRNRSGLVLSRGIGAERKLPFNPFPE
jgi:hypothetical protein